MIKFTETNTAENPTFNVNGTGAKSVWYSTSVITTSSLSYAGYANRPATYMYDGMIASSEGNTDCPKDDSGNLTNCRNDK